MKFEEALTALRAGSKIRHNTMEPDEYLVGCYIGLPGENFEESKSRGMSIVRIKGDREHPDMRPLLSFTKQMDLIDKYPFLKEKITFPTINLFLIMSDDWELIE